MKNILIISQFFAPKNSVAAIRFTKVVKYLARTGNYHFYIVCFDASKDRIQDEILAKDLQCVKENITLFPVAMNKIKKQKLSSEKNATIERKNDRKSLYKNIQDKLVDAKYKGIYGAICRWIGQIFTIPFDLHDVVFERAFARRGLEQLKAIENVPIHVMISTYGHIGAHLLGLEYMKKHPQTCWIADYRDPVQGKTWIAKRFATSYCKKVDMLAQYITGAFKECEGSGRCPEKFHVIYNSFDREDREKLGERRLNDRFTISYTGRIYHEKRDMSMLFSIIADLIRENKMDCDMVRVEYAGEAFEKIEKQAQKFGMEDLLINRGRISHKEALQLQYNSDITCILTWNNGNNDSNLPAKLYESFMMEKPVFAIVTGNQGNSNVRRIIYGTNAGCCIEEANFNEDYLMAKKWILSQYQDFLKNGSVHCELDVNAIEQYSSNNMALKFEELIMKCVNE